MTSDELRASARELADGVSFGVFQVLLRMLADIHEVLVEDDPGEDPAAGPLSAGIVGPGTPEGGELRTHDDAPGLDARIPDGMAAGEDPA